MTKKHVQKQGTEELAEKSKELEDQLKRVLADYQNLEKRVTEEKREWIKTANKELILRLLPVLDTLMLASNHVQNEGLKLSVQQFLDVLKSEGVEKVETVGSNFNPEIMECVGTEKGEDGKVTKEIRAGYTISGKTLRPALVNVGKENIEKEKEELAEKEREKGDYM